MRAKVRYVVEVTASGPWGDECTLAQAHQQAMEEADQTLDALLDEESPEGVRRVAARRVAKGEFVGIELLPEKKW